MYILAIESSCDETSAAVLKNKTLLSNIVYSQHIHSKYGGVIPEIAGRYHEKKIIQVIEKALQESEIKMSDIDCIAITYGAGLVSSLVVGINYAKGLALSLGIPIIGINHLEGHLCSNFINNNNLSYPFLCLLVTGGHTQIINVKRFGSYKTISYTVDDAAGEAFDKGAKILGFNYPGGPEIEKYAKSGDRKKYLFTIPKIKKNKLNFSFSGLKTALLYKVNSMNEQEFKLERNSLAASFQESIINLLLDRLLKVMLSTKIKNISIVGGVAANQRFKKRAFNESLKYGFNLSFPDLQYCTDNAAMIGFAAYNRLRSKQYSDFDIEAMPNLKL